MIETTVKELMKEHRKCVRQQGQKEYENRWNYITAIQGNLILGFTLDNKCDLDTFVGDAQSCVYHGDARAIHNLITGEFTPDDVYVKGDWKYLAGAFHGAEGGPC